MTTADLLISQVRSGATAGRVLSFWLDEQAITPEILQSFLMQDELNSIIWKDKKMKPKIRKQLLGIADDFFKTLDLDESVLDDITLTGSIANYNWSKFSDIDLHLRVDFEAIDENEKLVRNYVLAQKNLWNEKHKINIGGIPVEVYVENMGDTHIASGLYSLMNGQWIVEPAPKQLVIDLDDVKTKADAFLSVLDHVTAYIDQKKPAKALKVVEDTKAKVKQLRAAGLETGGEYSVENLAFKSLRRSGFLQRLTELGEEALALKES